jgi:hypothetical protein
MGRVESNAAYQRLARIDSAGGASAGSPARRVPAEAMIGALQGSPSVTVKKAT